MLKNMSNLIWEFWSSKVEVEWRRNKIAMDIKEKECTTTFNSISSVIDYSL